MDTNHRILKMPIFIYDLKNQTKKWCKATAVFGSNKERKTTARDRYRLPCGYSNKANTCDIKSI